MFKRLLQWLQRFFKWLLGGKWIPSQPIVEREKLAPPAPKLTNSDLEFLFTQLLEGVYQARGQEWALKYLQRMDHRIDKQRWLEWLGAFGDRLLASPSPNTELASRLIQLGELDIGEIGEVAYNIGIALMTRNLGNDLAKSEMAQSQMAQSQMAQSQMAEDESPQVWEHQVPDYFAEYEGEYRIETQLQHQQEQVWESPTPDTQEPIATDSQFKTIPQPWLYEVDTTENLFAPPIEEIWQSPTPDTEEQVSTDSQLPEPLQPWLYADGTTENSFAPPIEEIWQSPIPSDQLPPPTSELVEQQEEEKDIEISPTTPLNPNHQNHSIQVRQTPEEETALAQNQNPHWEQLQAPVADTLDELLVRLQQSASLVQQLSSGLHHQTLESPQLQPQEIPQDAAKQAQTCFFQGLQHAKNGNLTAALSSYERAIALQPQAYEYWFNTGLTLFHLGNYDSALTAYQRAIAIKPDLHKGWYNQGITLGALSRLEEAVAAFDQAIAMKPDYQEAWANRGSVLRKLKQYQPAIESYDRALQIQPQDPETLYHQGMVFAATGHIQAAIKNYGQALQLQPTHEDAWYKLGEALVKLGRSEDALPYYERAMELNPDHYQAWCGRSVILYNLGQYNEALVSSEMALEINPKYDLGWYQRGIILSSLGRPEEAITSYNRAIEITPQLELAWLQRGISLYQVEQWEAAITSFDRTIAIAPQNHEAWYFKGTALDKLARWQEAIAAYDQASQIQPDFHDVWIDKGVALIQLGQLEPAIAAWDKALELKPDFYLAWYNRGVALDNLQRYPEAVSSYDQAIYIQPDFDLAWYNRGLALFYLKQFEEAIASYDRALEIKPDYWEAWMSRASAVEKSPYCDPHLSFESAIADRNPALNQRGYPGKIATYEEGLKYIHDNTHPEPWGRLHLAIGNSLYTQGKREGIYRDCCLQAVAEYNLALLTLTPQDVPQLHLEVLQSLITALLGLGQIPHAQELHGQGMNLWGYLLGDDNLTDAGKKQLSLKVTGLGQLAVDLAIQTGEFLFALEIAEQSKNACLTWQLYGWSEEIYSPNYQSIQQLLNPTTAMVYWHISPYGIHTFVIKHRYPEPIHIFTPMMDPEVSEEFLLPEAVQRLVKLEDWLEDWDSQYQEYRQTNRDKQGQITHSWRLLMESRLDHLRTILNIANIEEELQDITQLILIPHRYLHRLPLHQLFTSNSDYLITYLPSIQMGLEGKSTQLSINNQPSLLSVEYPNSSGYLQLKFAKLQAEAVNQMFPNCTTIVAGEGTKQHLETSLEDHHHILHFNGYVINNFTNPQESALLLHGDDKLTLVDICQHSLFSYQLVTLVGNETMISKNQANVSIEYVGLTSGFLSQGVDYVFTTLWTVESAASTLIILEFYRNLQRDRSPIKALELARCWLREVTAGELSQWYDNLLDNLRQEELRNNADLATELYRVKNMSVDEKLYHHPYYWAAFTIVGNSNI